MILHDTNLDYGQRFQTFIKFKNFIILIKNTSFFNFWMSNALFIVGHFGFIIKGAKGKHKKESAGYLNIQN